MYDISAILSLLYSAPCNLGLLTAITRLPLVSWRPATACLPDHHTLGGHCLLATFICCASRVAGVCLPRYVPPLPYKRAPRRLAFSAFCALQARCVNAVANFACGILQHDAYVSGRLLPYGSDMPRFHAGEPPLLRGMRVAGRGGSSRYYLPLPHSAYGHFLFCGFFAAT